MSATGVAAAAAPPSVVATFGSHEAAEQAVLALQRAGYDLAQLSIVGKDYHTEERPVGFYNVGDRMRVWGSRGAFWGSLIGILVAPAFFLLPVLGHVVVFGPLTSGIVGALEGAAVTGGLSALAAALASLGIPRDSVMRFEASIRAGKFLLVVHGGGPSLAETEQLLSSAGAEAVETSDEW
jgi:hypothetical protein